MQNHVLDMHENRMSLEQARTELALKRLKREHLEGKLCDVDQILAAEVRFLSGIPPRCLEWAMWSDLLVKLGMSKGR